MSLSNTTLNVSILGDTSTQLISKYLKKQFAKRELQVDIYEADFDQIDQEISNPGSDYYSKETDYTVMLISAKKLQKNFNKIDPSARSSFAEKTITMLKSYIETINARTRTKVVLSNFIELPDLVFGNYGNRVEESWIYQIRKINVMIMDMSIGFSNVFVNDISALHSLVGQQQSYDPQIYIRADMANSLSFQKALAKNTCDIILACYGKFKKCLILDLDNTTWGGIIGDDGIEKIQVGSLGIGKAFTELQQYAKNLKERGIILAVCSKNTESVALEPFEKHPDMVLRLDDIAIFVANWENKADNIRYIQSVLNIGFDSMVFLDDNAFERNLVRQELPEVTVPELPKDPAEYVPYLETLNLFETASHDKLDSDRTKKYQEEAKRSQLQQSFTSLDDYLSSLDMLAVVKPYDEFNLPRIVQLSQRSNQFNLRTVRYSEQDVLDIIKADDKFSFYVSIKDKFGDYGLISLVSLSSCDGGKGLFIDNWIMSCRVLKRDVEKLLLNYIVKLGNEIKIDYIIGERIPTKKNILVQDHYKDLGFQQDGDRWKLTTSQYKPYKNHITVSDAVLV